MTLKHISCTTLDRGNKIQDLDIEGMKTALDALNSLTYLDLESVTQSFIILFNFSLLQPILTWFQYSPCDSAILLLELPANNVAAAGTMKSAMLASELFATLSPRACRTWRPCTWTKIALCRERQWKQCYRGRGRFKPSGCTRTRSASLLQTPCAWRRTRWLDCGSILSMTQLHRSKSMLMLVVE